MAARALLSKSGHDAGANESAHRPIGPPQPAAREMSKCEALVTAFRACTGASPFGDQAHRNQSALALLNSKLNFAPLVSCCFRLLGAPHSSEAEPINRLIPLLPSQGALPRLPPPPPRRHCAQPPALLGMPASSGSEDEPGERPGISHGHTDAAGLAAWSADVPAGAAAAAVPSGAASGGEVPTGVWRQLQG